VAPGATASASSGRIRLGACCAAAAVAAIVAAMLAPATADAASDDPRLAALEDFAFALGVDVDGKAVDRLAPYDLIVVDGQQTARPRVGQLRADGSVVLGYLSVGTLERFRPWFLKLRRFAIGYWHDWDEFYVRVNSPRYRRFVVRRIARAIERKGFDGLLLDSTDMIELYPGQTRGMVKLVRSLARLVHRRGDYLFTQNGDSVVHRFVPSLDGWNREDVTWSYGFRRHRYFHQRAAEVAHAQAMLERLGGEGLLVTAADYTATGDEAAFDQSVANACDAGALPFVGNIALTRIAAVPPACP
jgi:polysaccharide biosynthesis protein PelA